MSPERQAFNFGQRMVYLFFRAEGFYPLELGSDEEAVANAECNPGTLKVVRAFPEEIVWKQPEPQSEVMEGRT